MEGISQVDIEGVVCLVGCLFVCLVGWLFVCLFVCSFVRLFVCLWPSNLMVGFDVVFTFSSK